MRIVLTHIPRTGGTSLFTALKAQLPQAKAGEFESLAEIATMSDKELNSYEIISTYVGSKLFDRLEGEWTKIVVLRDPVARLKSSYWNLRNNPQMISFATQFAKSCGFREYLACRETPVIIQACNVQAWTILGDRSPWFREKYARVDDQKLTALSVERLAIYHFVGFTEHLEDIWQQICRYFAWPLTQLSVLRKNPPMPTIEEVSQEDLAYHTAIDSEIVRRVQNNQLPAVTLE